MEPRYNDTLHLQELVPGCFPLDSPLAKAAPKSPPLPRTPTIGKHRALYCCKKSWPSYEHLQDHWFKFHLEEALENAGKNPLTFRVAKLLSKFKVLPENPKRFRPAPHSKPPTEFKNPYSQASAMFYDYLLQSDTHEFRLFSERLLTLNPSLDSASSAWPFWAHYFYSNKSSPSETRHFPCVFKTCSKVYKKRHHLKYHMLHFHNYNHSYNFKIYKPDKKKFE